jgi:hypothetical protein
MRAQLPKPQNHAPQRHRVLLIGNCQVSIYLFLQQMGFAKNSNFTFDYFHIFKISETEMQDILQNVDAYSFLVTQHISETFRENPIFSTKNLFSHVDKTLTKVIMFPSCYFNFPFPYTTSKDKIYIEQLIDQLYTESQDTDIQHTLANFIKVISDPAHLGIDEMCARLQNSLESLHRRELEAVSLFSPDYFVYVSHFIRKNCAKCLFYTFNHPTKLVLAYIAAEVAKFMYASCTQTFRPALLENDTGMLADHLFPDSVIESFWDFDKNLDPLDKYKTPLLQCFQPFFDFDIRAYNQALMYRGQKCNLSKFFYLYCHLIPPKKNKSLILSNKNICSYMDPKIYKCNNSKKTSSKKTTPVFIKCVTTPTMNYNAKPNTPTQNTVAPPHPSASASVHALNLQTGPARPSLQASVHKKKKQLPKTLVRQKNSPKPCIC